MRKLSAIQVSALVGALVVGTGNVHAQEVPLATISVNGSQNTNAMFQVPTGVGNSSTPNYVGQYGSGISTANAHGINCAKKYATTGPGANQGAKSGWSTYIIADWGWANAAGNIYDTITANPPAPINGLAWGVLYGVTIPGSGQSLIFQGSNPTMGDLVNTLAHEWAHQFGALDLKDGSPNDAYAVGDKAEAAYLADKGAKCGGL